MILSIIYFPSLITPPTLSTTCNPFLAPFPSLTHPSSHFHLIQLLSIIVPLMQIQRSGSTKYSSRSLEELENRLIRWVTMALNFIIAHCIREYIQNEFLAVKRIQYWERGGHWEGFLGLNKFIMKVTQQRNPYLKRIYSQTPHKYSFDIESGKYFLLDQKGSSTHINLNGTFRPKFRSNYSGFVNHKTRYIDAPNDPSVLHFAPDPKPQSNYHNPVPDKFTGYAQFPYQIKPQLPTYLKKPGEPANYARRKAQSLIMGKDNPRQSDKKQKKATQSAILEYSTLREGLEEQKFFNSAWAAMSETKPLPKQKKRTCYNYKCKYLKQWVFDERGKMTESKAPVNIQNTLGRSFHQVALSQEMQESKLLSTMALSGVA